jgi:hypothetical protein
MLSGGWRIIRVRLFGCRGFEELRGTQIDDDRGKGIYARNPGNDALSRIGSIIALTNTRC